MADDFEKNAQSLQSTLHRAFPRDPSHWNLREPFKKRHWLWRAINNALLHMTVLLLVVHRKTRGEMFMSLRGELMDDWSDRPSLFCGRRFVDPVPWLRGSNEPASRYFLQAELVPIADSCTAAESFVEAICVMQQEDFVMRLPRSPQSMAATMLTMCSWRRNRSCCCCCFSPDCAGLTLGLLFVSPTFTGVLWLSCRRTWRGSMTTFWSRDDVRFSWITVCGPSVFIINPGISDQNDLALERFIYFTWLYTSSTYRSYVICGNSHSCRVSWSVGPSLIHHSDLVNSSL